MKSENLRKSSDVNIKEQVEREISNQIKILKTVIYAFFAGMTLLFATGLHFKEVFLLPLMQHIYPPSFIYSEIKQDLFNEISLSQTATLKNDVEEAVWHSMVAGDKEKFSKITNQESFMSSLNTKFNMQLVSAFGLSGSAFNGVLNANEELRKAILDKSKEWQRADIRIVAKSLDNDTTSCGKRFSHKDYVAIVRIPHSASTEKFSWLKCGGLLEPHYSITISSDTNTISGIRLIGIERSGDSESLELKVSRAVAKKLDLPNWEKFQSRVIGSYKVDDVTWN